MNSPAFSGKTIIVTGASRGIGKAIAELLLDAGAFVIGTATKQSADEWKHERLVFKYVDFSDSKSTQRFIEKEIVSAEKIDGLINNAGINIIKPLNEVSENDYDALLAVDLKAPYLLCQAVAAVMKKNGGGRIVNLASIWSEISKPKRALYSAAKTGLVGMTRGMAVELGTDGILVNCVSPGFTLTDLTRQSLSAAEIKELSEKIPMGRMAQPAEIAGLVCYLCSDGNTYITGQNIVIDGGFTIV
jgi:3-oxoacyl-[acyl-carrier protein] reductase